MKMSTDLSPAHLHHSSSSPLVGPKPHVFPTSANLEGAQKQAPPRRPCVMPSATALHRNDLALPAAGVNPNSEIGLVLYHGEHLRVAEKRRRTPSPKAIYKIRYFPSKNFAMFSFRNFESAGSGAAPAGCPHNDGIGNNFTPGMKLASYRASPTGKYRSVSDGI